MSWARSLALLSQDLPSLEARIKRVLPEPFVCAMGLEEDPPAIFLFVSKPYVYGREHPLLGKITQTLFEPDLPPVYAQIAHVLQSFPKLNVKTRNKEGILLYKFWRD